MQKVKQILWIVSIDFQNLESKKCLKHSVLIVQDIPITKFIKIDLAVSSDHAIQKKMCSIITFYILFIITAFF